MSVPDHFHATLAERIHEAAKLLKASAELLATGGDLTPKEACSLSARLLNELTTDEYKAFLEQRGVLAPERGETAVIQQEPKP